MTNHYPSTQEVLQSASSTLADGTAAAADLATNAAHTAAVWAEKAPGQAKDIWDEVVSNFDDVVIFPKRARKRRKRTILICVTAAVVVGAAIAVATQRRKANASEENSATAAE